ncbi:MAG: hypothetical protein EOP14_04320 [Pseudomonas sp.]|nr:MAG: hypothetical protein EOP14_04320 [Pseudomonas sp.]
MNNRTPGPWSLDQYHNVVGVDKQEIRAIGLVLTSGTEAKANSRLIAASPDLLEALQLIVRGYGVSFQDAALKTLATEAIAKATGEPS